MAAGPVLGAATVVAVDAFDFEPWLHATSAPTATTPRTERPNRDPRTMRSFRRGPGSTGAGDAGYGTARTTTLRPMDRIAVRGIRAMGVHGVLAEEQFRAQPFEVDVELAVDVRAAGESDVLADTGH